ncbi:uncharacterized protein [Nicotiana tomentosiformis]|uniref:uncharacterized protein n=1 Tax=Nicotiana tomentosiformis TaxID=4098 RepID=UPI00388CA539
MKRNVTDFVARCLNCQQVKAEHKRHGGLAQNIEIPMWKWEMINMYFVVGLTRTPHFKGSWDDHLPLVEFSYNNSYHASIEMAPLEALYGRICRSPIGWFEIGEAELIGPDLVHHAMEKVKMIKERLKTAQSRQKSYSDKVVGDPTFIVPVETIEVNEGLTHEEIPVSIIDRWLGPIAEDTLPKYLNNLGVSQILGLKEVEMLEEYPSSIRSQE